MIARTALQLLSSEDVFATGTKRPILVRAAESENGASERLVSVVVKPADALKPPARIVSELVCSAWAAAVGIPTPRVWACEVSNELASVLSQDEQPLRSGIVLASEYLENARQVQRANKVANDAGARILAFDYLIRNVDRVAYNTNALIVGTDAYAIDHEQALDYWLEGREPDEDFHESVCMIDHIFLPRLRAFVAQRGDLHKLVMEIASPEPGTLAAAKTMLPPTFAPDLDWARLRTLPAQFQQNVDTVVRELTLLSAR